MGTPAEYREKRRRTARDNHFHFRTNFRHFQVELYEFQLIILFSTTFHTYIIHFYQNFEERKPKND